MVWPLAEIERRAEEDDQRRLQRERHERERQEGRQQAVERAKEQFAHNSRAKILQEQGAATKLAADIRQFVDHVRVDGLPADRDWLDWAERHAESVDPAEVHGPDVPEPKSDELKPHLGWAA
ncbi:MAG: hypothetical protein WD757_03095 [Actinomycetota bacterium]